MRSAIFILLVAILAISVQVLELNNMQRAIVAAVVLTMILFSYIVYDVFSHKKRSPREYVILAIPVVSLGVLLVLDRILRISQLAVWIIFVTVTILCVGMAQRISE